MALDGSKFNPFSQAHADDLAALQAEVDRLAQMVSLQVLASNNGYGRIPFRVSSSTISTSYPIWKYTLIQVKPKSSTGTDDDWEDVSGGINTGDIGLNDLEAGNTSTSAYGYAVTYTSSAWHLSTAPFTECIFKPVPNDTIVWAIPVHRPDGTMRWSFSAPNPITPGCEA